MGGYSARSGIAWRLPLDPSITTTAFELVEDPGFTSAPAHPTSAPRDPTQAPPTPPWSNNFFEFILLWLEAWHGHLPPESPALCLSDNSSAVGWMHKASYGLTKPRHAMISKKLTELSLYHRFTIQTEHIPGSSNTVADALSRRFDLDDIALTSFIHDHFHSQIPENFCIKQLPNKI